MSFNPSSPRSIGVEWLPSSHGQTPLIADTDAIGIVTRSSLAETIDQLRLPHTWSDAGSYRKLQVDIYRLGQEGLADVSQLSSYTPNEDVTHGAWARYVNGALDDSNSNLWSSIDDVGTAVDDTDWVQRAPISVSGAPPQPTTSPNPYVFRFNTAGFATSRRPLGVSFKLRGQWPNLQGRQYSKAFTMRRNGADVADLLTPTFWPYGTPPLATFATYTLGPFYVNPHTQLPWTATDIIDFDSAYSIAMEFMQYGGTLRISSVEMLVEWVPETRVAWGSLVPTGYESSSPPSSTQVRDDVPLQLQHSDTAGDDWSKLNTTDYVTVVRRLPYVAPRLPAVVPSTPSFPYIEALRENPHRNGQSIDVTIDQSGRLIEVGDLNRRTYSQSLVLAAGSLSVDSQVYQYVDQGGAASAPVSTQQSFTAVDNRTYGTIRGQVGYFAGNPPDAPLAIQIRRASDNVAMGSSVTISYDDLIEQYGIPYNFTRTDSQNARIHDVLLQLATPATLVAGTAYYIEFTSTSVIPWLINAARWTQPSGTTGDRSQPGQMTYAGTPFSADLLLTIIDKPAPVGTFTATLGTDAIEAPGDVRCDLGSMPRVDLAWSSTVLGALFDYYEIQRDDGFGWQTIRTVRGETVTTYTDRSMARNVAVSYRLRVVRNDGGISDWATAAAVTPVMPRNRVDLVSPHADIAQAYLELGSSRDLTFPTTDEVLFRILYGRDYEQQSRPTNVRGVRYPLRLLVWMGGGVSNVPTAGEGRRAFAALRSLVENATIPYVVVLTPDGDRVLAAVTMAAPSTQHRTAQMYVSLVNVREITATPVPVDG